GWEAIGLREEAGPDVVEREPVEQPRDPRPSAELREVEPVIDGRNREERLEDPVADDAALLPEQRQRVEHPAVDAVGLERADARLRDDVVAGAEVARQDERAPGHQAAGTSSESVTGASASRSRCARIGSSAPSTRPVEPGGENSSLSWSRTIAPGRSCEVTRPATVPASVAVHSRPHADQSASPRPRRRGASTVAAVAWP